MTDKEMLEYAAKAAGWIYYPPHQLDIKFDKAGWIDPATGGVYWEDLWNPLTDDGDALRLAVKLRLTVSREDQGAVKAGWVADQRVPFTSDGCGPWYWKEWLKDHNWDPYAATRLAIVRAASEIGKGIAQTVSTDLPEDNYYKSMAEAEETGRAVEMGRKL